MDGEGNYYHVEKERGSGYSFVMLLRRAKRICLRGGRPEEGEGEGICCIRGGCEGEARRRAESVQRERQQNEGREKAEEAEEIKDVLPFRMGMKWGAEMGEIVS